MCPDCNGSTVLQSHTGYTHNDFTTIMTVNGTDQNCVVIVNDYIIHCVRGNRHDKKCVGGCLCILPASVHIWYSGTSVIPIREVS